MKNILFFFVCLLPAGSFCQTVFYTETNMPPALQQTYQGMFDMRLIAVDVANLLSDATGKKYTAKPYEKNALGIILLLDSNYSHTSNEAGTVTYISPTSITIKAKYATGISYAVYSWLQQLGFQFGLPGNEWTIKPKLANLQLSFSQKTYFPHFRLRTFYASGGMYPVKELDEERKNEKEWWLWYRRNRMGCDYFKVDGHIGELFNIVHKKEITEDPNILAPIDGKRVYSIGGKIDPTYTKGVNMFSDWIITEFTKEQATLPKFLPFKKYYSVDPGDGLDYCHTANCEQQFPSVSDQVFYIANYTARKIKKADPLAGVSLLAYTERSDTPSLKIDNNVHVMVVPTAFQGVSTSTELMQRWRKKTANISQYDFLNIGVWSLDQPFFDMRNYISRLQFLQRLEIEGMSFETSMSKFASGIQQYFILKFLCEPYASADSVLKSYCKSYFQQAAIPIEKLFREWYFSDVHINTNKDKESFQPDELGRFLDYIQQAKKLATQQNVKERIEELQSYVVYLCHFYEMFQSPEYKKQTAQKAEVLLDFSWNLYTKNILHNSQLNDMLKKYATDASKWDYTKPGLFIKYKIIPNQKLLSEFYSMQQKYPPVHYTNELNDSFLNKMILLSADSIRISSMDESAFGKFIYPIPFYSAGPSTVTIQYQTGNGPKIKSDKLAIIACEAADYSFIQTKFIYQQSEKGTITFSIPAKGQYKLILSYFQGNPVQFIIYPKAQIFYIHKKSILMNGLLLQTEQKKLEKGLGALAFINPTDNLQLEFPYETAYVPIKVFGQNGKSLTFSKNKSTLTYQPEKRNNFLFYANEVYRWPPVLKNTAPYFFYLKVVQP